ncbi:UNVERIFIED_CONTAM: hypothetical protein GTU68_001849 [Idotea baltica]|nr:hypothetical protein [Idotea baltica]
MPFWVSAQAPQWRFSLKSWRALMCGWKAR